MSVQWAPNLKCSVCGKRPISLGDGDNFLVRKGPDGKVAWWVCKACDDKRAMPDEARRHYQQSEHAAWQSHWQPRGNCIVWGKQVERWWVHGLDVHLVEMPWCMKEIIIYCDAPRIDTKTDIIQDTFKAVGETCVAEMEVFRPNHLVRVYSIDDGNNKSRKWGLPTICSIFAWPTYGLQSHRWPLHRRVEEMGKPAPRIVVMPLAKEGFASRFATELCRRLAEKGAANVPE